MSVTLDRIRLHYANLADAPLLREFFGQSDFLNFGYWNEHTRTAREACENLVETLLEFFPERTGPILDVACGLGATTRHLSKYYRPAEVTAINICERQLARSRINAPGCRFTSMDAAKLGFADASFNAMICVEAAFHFDTRLDFLKEAYRVLKPGGSIVLSDVLVDPAPSGLLEVMPKANHVGTIDEYKHVWAEAGFREVTVVDATAEVWQAFCGNLSSWAQQRNLDRRHAQLVSMWLRNHYKIQQYLLVAARRHTAPHN